MAMPKGPNTNYVVFVQDITTSRIEYVFGTYRGFDSAERAWKRIRKLYPSDNRYYVGTREVQSEGRWQR